MYIKMSCCDNSCYFEEKKSIVLIRGPRGFKGEDGPTGTCNCATGANCEIINSDNITRVSVCDNNIIRGVANDKLLITSSDKLDETQLFLDIPSGSLRVGDFPLSKLTDLGTLTQAFGYHTEALGVANLSYGYAGVGSRIFSLGNSNLVGGEAKIDSTILCFEESSGSLVHGVSFSDSVISSSSFGTRVGGKSINKSEIRTLLDSAGSNSFGFADLGSKIYTGISAHGSNSQGYAFDTGNIYTGISAHGSNSQGYAFDTGNIYTGISAYGSNAQGVAYIRSNIYTNYESFGSNAQGSAYRDSSIYTGTSAWGSNAQGSVFINSNIYTGIESYGSNAQGRAFNTGNIYTGTSAYGSNAQGYAFINSNIYTGNSSFGSNALGFASNTGNIYTGTSAYGSNAQGYASNTGNIYTGTLAYGSNAQGYATNTGKIYTGLGSHGSNAQGYTNGLNSAIYSGGNSEGVSIGGVATNGGKIFSGTGSSGSIVHGLSDGSEKFIAVTGNVAGSLAIGAARSQIIGENSIEIKSSGCVAIGTSHTINTDCNYSQAFGRGAAVTNPTQQVLSAGNHFNDDFTPDDTNGISQCSKYVLRGTSGINFDKLYLDVANTTQIAIPQYSTWCVTIKIVGRGNNIYNTNDTIQFCQNWDVLVGYEGDSTTLVYTAVQSIPLRKFTSVNASNVGGTKVSVDNTFLVVEASSNNVSYFLRWTACVETSEITAKIYTT